MMALQNESFIYLYSDFLRSIYQFTLYTSCKYKIPVCEIGHQIGHHWHYNRCQTLESERCHIAHILQSLNVVAPLKMGGPKPLYKHFTLATI